MTEIDGVKYYSEKEIDEGVANGVKNCMSTFMKELGEKDPELVFIFTMHSAMIGSEIRSAIKGKGEPNED